MKKFSFNFVLSVLLILTSCDTPSNIQNSNNFTVNKDQFLKNGSVFDVKGVVYVPCYPGHLPWDIELMDTLPDQLYNSFYNDLSNIKAMGANTVRLWGAPEACYSMIDMIGGLHIIQTIWINGEVSDLQDSTFKELTKADIRNSVDKIYSAFTDNDPPVVAYIVGNEISESSITATNTAHPEINSFRGNYFKPYGVNASEAFIAEMADYVKSYEFDTYDRLTPVSYANDIRTTFLVDTPFLDFRCQNAYSYAIPYYRWGTLPGSSSGTQFQGWLEEVKAIYPDVPLLISETGLSVSPNATSPGPPSYGYGGNTEQEQAEGILQNLNDINTASYPMAGVCIHEYLDSWWKFGQEDSYSQDPDDIEEWFGLARFIPSSDVYETELRHAYYKIQEIWDN